MFTLRIVNVGETDITLQDPSGITSFSCTIAKGATVDKDVSQDLLERLAPLLKKWEGETHAATTKKVIAGLRWSLLKGDDIDIRMLNEGVVGQPVLTLFPAASYSTGTGAATVACVGTGLLGGQTKATAQLLSGTARLDLEAVIPGSPSNAYSCEIVISGSSAIDVAVANGKITITVKTAGETVADIFAAVNADTDAKLLVKASEGVAGTVTAAVAETNLEDGEGPGASLSLGGTACSILAVTATALTCALPTGVGANGNIVPLTYKCGPTTTQLSIPVVT